MTEYLRTPYRIIGSKVFIDPDDQSNRLAILVLADLDSGDR